MIEMKVRIDDDIDLAGISVDRFEACADLLAGVKADPEKPGKPGAEPSSGVVLAIGVQPGVEQCPSFRVFDQKDGDGHGDLPLSAIHEMGELGGHCTASK